MVPQNTIPPAGLMSHSGQEIARILESLQKLARPTAPASEALNAALLAHPRVSFISEFSGWHVEFAAADPQSTTLAGKHTIRLRFPEVVVTQQRRDEPRAALPPVPPLHCVADTQGFAPFEARIVDISRSGIGILLYSSDITLEPGTVLKGCRIERRGAPATDGAL